MDDGKLPDKVTLKKRLLWWFGIYFGFQLPLILLFPFILNFPWGLAPYFAFVFDSSNEPAFRTMGYLFYLTHFLVSMACPNRKLFRALMVVLIIIVCLNTASCMKSTNPLWYKGIGNIQG